MRFTIRLTCLPAPSRAKWYGGVENLGDYDVGFHEANPGYCRDANGQRYAAPKNFYLPGVHPSICARADGCRLFAYPSEGYVGFAYLGVGSDVPDDSFIGSTAICLCEFGNGHLPSLHSPPTSGYWDTDEIVGGETGDGPIVGSSCDPDTPCNDFEQGVQCYPVAVSSTVSY